MMTNLMIDTYPLSKIDDNSNMSPMACKWNRGCEMNRTHFKYVILPARGIGTLLRTASPIQ